MIDPVFGDITFSEVGGWEGSYTILFLGREVTVRMALGGWDEADPVEPVQRDAVEQFTARKAELCGQADDALYFEYLQRQPELREQFGDDADRLMPIIDGKEGLSTLVTPDFFQVPLPRRSSTDRVVALMYNCSWDVELGLAVKFVNESIAEVGPQNIVL
ncbi:MULTISPECIES: DUF6985 domain-containing protein [Mycobacteriaceae]|uniref:DUF6985 domain-containing protein n=2 Tax=Mycolicibacterium TaxID=1866885 RepID=A0ABR5FM83_9MYCO|nr:MULTISPECIES: hypothetical protein [Mycobacteriaceae]KLI09246.1 hypothetical protein AA982_03980 [Mycolicibacterium senegalense]KLO47639.1 hypothetical protein ABW05_31000 [Mycolicibacterium senegalense]OLT94351.1 hypothetical protein BKG60_18830 [Mycobacterium syngnathidarum]